MCIILNEPNSRLGFLTLGQPLASWPSLPFLSSPLDSWEDGEGLGPLGRLIPVPTWGVHCLWWQTLDFSQPEDVEYAWLFFFPDKDTQMFLWDQDRPSHPWVSHQMMCAVTLQPHRAQPEWCKVARRLWSLWLLGFRSHGGYPKNDGVYSGKSHEIV